MVSRLAAPVVLAIMLTGCGSIGAIGIPGISRGDTRPPPVTAAPQPPVQTSALPPPGQVGQQQTIQSGGAQDPFLPQRTMPPASGGFVQQPPAQPSGTLQPLPQQQASAAPAQQQVAATQPSSGGIGRTDLLGGWTISSAGDSCQLFMTLTSWRGGYRASTRGCSNDTLKGISAWDLKGSQVVLSGQAGTPVATLFSSGGNRFNGTTSGDGGAVSFFR